MLKLTPESKKLLKAFERAIRDILDVIRETDSAYYRAERIRRLRQIQEILEKLDKSAGAWAKKQIPRAYRGAAADMVKTISGFDEKEFKILSFTGVPEKAVDVLVQQSVDAFGTSLQGVYRETKKLFDRMERAAVQEKIISGLIRGEATEATKEEILAEFKKFGLTAFRAKAGAGRRFSLRDYSDLLVRSQYSIGYNTGAQHRLITAGRKFAMVDTIRPDIDGYDICNVWEGKIIDLTTGKIPGYEAANPKVARPPFHPRCRHTLIPISFEQIKEKFPEKYDEAVDFYHQKKKK